MAPDSTAPPPLEADARDLVQLALDDMDLHRELARTAAQLRLFEAVLDQGRDALLLTDGDLGSEGLRIGWANDAAAVLLGRPTSDLLGQPLLGLEGLDLPAHRVLDELERRGSWEAELARGPTEAPTHLEVRITTVTSPGGVCHMSVSLRDVSERKRIEGRLQHLAHHDHLTGLPNRKLLMDRLDLALARARRYREALALVFLDLDGFKDINDTVGHEAGDHVLQVVGRRLSRLVRASDTVARLGGDEFVLLLPGIGHPVNAERVADKALQVISEVIQHEANELFVTPSLGIAHWPEHGHHAESLLRHADQAMYQAKARGKAAWVVWNPSLSAEEQHRNDLLHDLAHALERSELHLHGQPIVDASTGQVETVEVLLRWTHSQRGRISPALFLPLLGEAGLEDLLLGWMLGQALDALQAYDTGAGVSLDLRAAWLRRRDLVPVVLDALQAAGIEPARLTVEVSETLLLRLPAEAGARLEDLRSAGVRVIVDHYGTSHLSLPQLRALPIDGMKVDAGLVRRVREDPTLVRGLVTLCRSLGLSLVADGVVEHDQRQILSDLEADLQQGPSWGRPRPLAAVLGRLRLPDLAAG